MTVTTTTGLDSSTITMIQQQVKPLAGLVVLVANQETTSSGGIVLSATNKEVSGKGYIVAVGPEKTDDNGQTIRIPVQAGQTVYYSKYSGTEINIQGVQATILKVEDILAIETAQ